MILSPLHRSFLSMMAVGITLGGLGIALMQKMDLRVVSPAETDSAWDMPDDVPLIAIARAEVSDVDVDSEILGLVGLDPAQLEWKDVFAKETPENLYLKMYDQNKNEAGRAAMTETAESIGYSEDELQKILRFDQTTIATYAASEHLTYAQAVATFQEVQNQYNEELDMQQLASDLRADIYPIEIFANGTIDDSGFDLINDLANMEVVIFKNSTITAPGAFGGDTAAGASTDDSDDDDDGSDDDSDDDSSDDADDTDSTTDDEASDADDESDDGSTDSDDDASTESDADDVESPLACLVDDTLSDAISDAIAAEEEAAGDDGSDDGEDSGGSATDSLPDDGVDKTDITEKQSTFDNITAEEAASWTEENLCASADGEIFSVSFCIEISFTYNPKTSYETTDNCIACHIEQMRDRMTTVLEKNLTPNKVTGNLSEGSKCNKGFLASGIDLKIIPIAQPLQTPPNDDVIVDLDPAKTLQSLRNAVSPGRPIGEKEKAFDPPVGASAAAQALSKFVFGGVSASFQDVADEADRIVAEQEEQQAQAVFEAKLQGPLAADATFYEEVKNQMQDMNMYFNAFLENVKRLLYAPSDSPNSTPACGAIQQKGICPK